MAQTLEKGAGLTAGQKQFLGVVQKEEYILKNFYLTGGTALSSWYLHHRESYDLDFFSERPFDGNLLIQWIKNKKPQIGYDSVRFDEDWGFLTVFIDFYPRKESLHVDFHHYRAPRLKKGIVWNGLTIDSLWDIAVNKTATLAERPRARDYVDLYAIIQKTNWKLSNLAHHAEQKFSMRIGKIQLAKNLLKVKEYKDLPKMLVPFSERRMKDFYEELARSLKTEIFTSS